MYNKSTANRNSKVRAYNTSETNKMKAPVVLLHTTAHMRENINKCSKQINS